VSLDGLYVVYTAVQNERAQVFLRDTCEGAAAGCQPRTTLLSVAADGSAANEESHTPSSSSDGRYVAFSSAATNLLENAPAGRQIYMRDTRIVADSQALNATHFSIRTARCGTQASSFRQFFRRFVAFWPSLLVIPQSAKFNELPQQRLSPGFHSRYMLGRGQLHAKDDSHFNSTR
jgi:hypothetical protein